MPKKVARVGSADAARSHLPFQISIGVDFSEENKEQSEYIFPDPAPFTAMNFLAQLEKKRYYPTTNSTPWREKVLGVRASKLVSLAKNL